MTFAMDLAYMTVEKPAGYDAVKEQALLESYAGQEDDTDSSEKKEELPNIIVVMNESFSDLNVLGDFTTNEDYMAVSAQFTERGRKYGDRLSECVCVRRKYRKYRV